MIEQPKPCPFCQSVDSLETESIGEGNGGSRFVECAKCHARGPNAYGMGSGSVNVIKLWNKRKDLEERDE